MNVELLEKIKKHLEKDISYSLDNTPQKAIRNHVGCFINWARDATDLREALKHIKKARNNFKVIVSTGIINREWIYHVYRAIDNMEHRIILKHTKWMRDNG